MDTMVSKAEFRSCERPSEVAAEDTFDTGQALWSPWPERDYHTSKSWECLEQQPLVSKAESQSAL